MCRAPRPPQAPQPLGPIAYATWLSITPSRWAPAHRSPPCKPYFFCLLVKYFRKLRGGLVHLKDLEGPRSCRRAPCCAPPTASRHAARRAQRRPASHGRRAAAGSAAAPWAQQFVAPEMLPQGGASSPPRSTAVPETRRGAASGGDDETAAVAPAVGKKDLACCMREPTARAEEHSSEAAWVTCSCRSRRWATFKIVRQVIRGLYRAASRGGRGAPGRRTPDQRREKQVLRDAVGSRVG